MSRKRVAVLISGRGSNLAALLAAAQQADYPAQIVTVIANRADAAGLEHASAAGVATQVVPHRAYPNRPAFEAALQSALDDAGAELVCLAGFMRVLTADFVTAWAGRMLNIHPSLLPAFPGLDTHRRALEAGVRLHGCTVHLVAPEVDTGPILIQAALAVAAGDTAESLAQRVLALEHRIYPQALAWLAGGLVRLENGRATVAGSAASETALIAPVFPSAAPPLSL